MRSLARRRTQARFLSSVCETMKGDWSMVKKEERFNSVCLGNATFSFEKGGPIPKNLLLNKIYSSKVVILTEEFRTSKLCIGCYYVCPVSRRRLFCNNLNCKLYECEVDQNENDAENIVRVGILNFFEFQLFEPFLRSNPVSEL